MGKYMEVYNKYRNYILFSILLIIIVIGDLLIYYYLSNDILKVKQMINENKTEVKKEETTQEDYVIDIKGEVKKPGVYTISKDKRVIDVVKKAGGFTKSADTTSNNLSKKLKDEMVIVIYSRDEINDYLETKEKEKQLEDKCQNDISNNDSCISNDENNSDSKDPNNSSKDTEETKKLVNINTASKEELTTISGIGESKALAIIEYRSKQKFESIEDIKNVSGIGDSLYEKIKDYITT